MLEFFKPKWIPSRKVLPWNDLKLLLMERLEGTIADGLPVLSVSAKFNFEDVCEYIVKNIPLPPPPDLYYYYYLEKGPCVSILGSIDVNKPAPKIGETKGVVFCGSLRRIVKLNIHSIPILARVYDEKLSRVRLKVKSPVFEMHQRFAISRNVENQWRLIAFGYIQGGTTVDGEEMYPQVIANLGLNL
ncbi:hypothetical protein Pint_36296 [Pistacia integerrima]|uniref:Uncharacterized protein n=1 Tax=Pistacia integerrima TaxID=434235 RepID=A0ACC0Y0S0_9ROSI|nr:hypothetical protein Pint_36296 [Pistacia integerrima]